MAFLLDVSRLDEQRAAPPGPFQKAGWKVHEACHYYYYYYYYYDDDDDDDYYYYYYYYSYY